MDLVPFLIIWILTFLAVVAMQIYYVTFIIQSTSHTATLSIYEGEVPFTPTSFSDTFTVQDGRIFTPQQQVVMTGIIVYHDHTINNGITYTGNLWSSTARVIMETIQIPPSSSTSSGWITYPLQNQHILNKNEDYYVTLGYSLNSPRVIFNTATPFLPYTNNGVTLGGRISSTVSGFPNIIGSNTFPQPNNITAIDILFYH